MANWRKENADEYIRDCGVASNDGASVRHPYLLGELLVPPLFPPLSMVRMIILC